MSNIAVTDLSSYRKEFPVLERSMRGKPLIYFDNGATSLKPQQVIDEELRYYQELSANIHRGLYELSEQATVSYDRARDAVKSLLNVNEDGEVIFTRGTTESINTVAYSWGRVFLKEGDEIVTSELEHHSNLVPWQEVAKVTGALLKFIPLTPEGSITAEAVDQTITPKTRFVAISGMSNVTGFRPPIRRIIEAAHAVGAKVLIDGAQYASHAPVDVQELDCDFLAFSGHKMCGPTGVGVLYAKKELLEAMPPFLYGGDMIDRVYKEYSTYARLPEKFEAGTPNIAGVMAFGKAVEFLAEVGLERIEEHEQQLIAYTDRRAEDVPWITSYGKGDSSRRGGMFSFNIEGVHAHDVGSLLDQQGIAVRTGFHCAQPLMDFFGISGTVRASFYLYNTTAEIDRFFDALERVYQIFGA
ncbi:MAG: aminotransferase class V-fold PLP-dependent enzyme [Alkalispirochaetaceae bacterium]